MPSLLRSIRDANIRLSDALTPASVQRDHAYERFEHEVSDALLSSDVRTVLDVGAGRKFHFESVASRRTDLRIIGQDISGEEMQDNPSLSERVVGDACERIDLPEGSVDLVLARATIEHLSDVDAFLRNVYFVLRPGGRLAVTFANRWATFAVINQILPSALKRKLLSALVPNSAGVLGFDAHYDNSSYPKFRDALIRAGLEEDVSYCSYYGSYYFRFFTPLWMTSFGIDLLRQTLGVKALSSYNTFVFRKPVA